MFQTKIAWYFLYKIRESKIQIKMGFWKIISQNPIFL